MQPEILGKTIESLLKNLKAPTPSDKLTGKLTDTKPDEVTELLTSVYSQLVANRGRTLERKDETSEKIRKVSNWLTSSPKRGLLLHGRTGTGKTILMESLKEVLRVGRTYDTRGTNFRLKCHKYYYQITAKTPDKTPQKFRLAFGVSRISRTFVRENG